MLRNKCHSSYCLLNSFCHHILPHSTWHISQSRSGTPTSISCQYPMRLFGIGITCNDRIALIVVFKWFEFYRFFNEKIPFFFFLRERRWGSNPRPHRSQSRIILSATPLWGSINRLKMLSNKWYHEFSPSKLVFQHNTAEIITAYAIIWIGSKSQMKVKVLSLRRFAVRLLCGGWSAAARLQQK